MLQSYVALLRRLRHRERAADGAAAAGEADHDAHRERLLLAQETVTAFMEDVISHMAGYVPLKAIAERILAAYARDPFGDFKVGIILLLYTFKILEICSFGQPGSMRNTQAAAALGFKFFYGKRTSFHAWQVLFQE